MKESLAIEVADLVKEYSKKHDQNGQVDFGFSYGYLVGILSALEDSVPGVSRELKEWTKKLERLTTK